MITVAILLPVDNRRYFAYGRILDNRLVQTSNNRLSSIYSRFLGFGQTVVDE